MRDIKGRSETGTLEAWANNHSVKMADEYGNESVKVILTNVKVMSFSKSRDNNSIELNWCIEEV